MTNEDAIEIMYAERESKERVYSEFEAYNMAIKALEKQIPKKPKQVANLQGISFDRYVCPKCNAVISAFIGRNFVKMPTCYCGQRIDWSEE